MADPRAHPALWTPSVRSETRPDGSVLVWQEEPLRPWPRCISARFMDWAGRVPDRVWMAERGEGGAWRETTYATGARAIAGIGSALLARRLSAERPVLILSGNSTAHALMALGAQHVGVPSAALAPAYALTGGDHAKLRDVAAQLSPGLIFADDAARFAPAIDAVFPPDIPVVALRGEVPGRDTIPFAALAGTAPAPDMEAAHAAVGPQTVAKFLFTSGTTGSPKAVIQTQGMLCANQQMVLQCYAFMGETPPVVVDWAPWNHTASGNKVFNLVIWNGGTYYIDDGRPTPDLIGRTIANLREISPTWYFNVPLGYQMLLDAMETDQRLRETFFARVRMLMYAGAGMSQAVWDRITRVAEEMVPGGVLLCTGFGATETGPFALMCTDRQERAGNLGIPAHGVTLKLVPDGDRFEARVKSPSVTPGYWRNPGLTAEAFDAEGFYRFGDALRFAVPGDPAAGFVFDGRLAENFKLASGTWVAVGPAAGAAHERPQGARQRRRDRGRGPCRTGRARGARLGGAARCWQESGTWRARRFCTIRRSAAPRRRGSPPMRRARRARPRASRGSCSWPRPCPSTGARSPTRARSTSAPSCVTAADLVASLWSDDPRVIALATERTG
jgi:feruloyl-CoA synthase